MYIHDSTEKEMASQIKNYVGKFAVMISIAEGSTIDIPLFLDELRRLDVVFIGGIFPKVIHDNTLFDKGLIINRLQNLQCISVVNDLSQAEYDIPTINLDSDKHYSLITLVDGLATNISRYLTKLYASYGMQVNYFGGGAGSLSLVQQNCVFTNEGFFMDTAVFAIIELKSSIGVKHGWHKIEGPLIATKTEGNLIKTINWKNPFEVYREIVEKHLGKKVFDNADFLEISKGFPFGIVKENSECIVRDPIALNEKNEIICVGEVEENTLFDILEGDLTSLVTAADEATDIALTGSSHPKKALIIDCVSRVLFLQDDYQKELDVIVNKLRARNGTISISGALTLGEISSVGDGFLDFYNKTIVIGLFEEV